MNAYTGSNSDVSTERPKRKCSIQPTVEDISESRALPQKLRTSSPAPKLKSQASKGVFPVVPLRISIPAENDCKLSDDLADSCRTLCKVCNSAVTLTGMRFHTLTNHKLQITRYKELYGPFEIIEHVFHKCHICGKILLLDSDAMGGHIKGTHKMKEKVYKERFMINTNQPGFKSEPKTIEESSKIKSETKTSEVVPKKSKERFMTNTNQSSNEAESKIGGEVNVSSKKKSQSSSSKPQYDFKTTFPDFEYSCNMKHCELCEHGGANVLLEVLANSQFVNESNTQDSDNPEEGIAEEVVAIKESCSLGQGGWSKKFLPTDILFSGEFEDGEDRNYQDERFNDESLDYSEESLLEDSEDSSSDSSEEDDSMED
jgi:hypothetical protein